ncbi:type I methionyl aminopeptidase [soil metagenome]
MFTRVKSPSEIQAMRESGAMLATVLDILPKQITVGMSTKDVANIARSELNKLGGAPAFLGYQGFPDVICISVNDEVVHGIPRPDRILKDGDIVGLDFGVNYRGMITDSAVTVVVGEWRDKQDKKLVSVTQEAMLTGIQAVHDRVRTGDIGAAIEAILSHHKFGIVRDLVGHGVGHELHEDPNIPNYGRANTGPWLSAGMTIAIEPMATRGREAVYLAPDDWTILTQDGSRSAHFEHSILITDDGAEILTQL